MKKKPTLAEVRQWAVEAQAEWLQEHGGRDAIRNAVFETLDKRLEAVVAGVVGFRCDTWGRWEVDTINGRRSLASTSIETEAKVAAEKWLREQLGALPPMPKQVISSARKHYIDELTDALRNQVGEMAHNRAASLADEMAAALEAESDDDPLTPKAEHSAQHDAPMTGKNQGDEHEES